MKMSKSKNGKSYQIISDNTKMDTSGMAGKPMTFDDIMGPIEYTPPPMTIGQMMERKAMEKAKK
jgi:hypothetical protein